MIPAPMPEPTTICGPAVGWSSTASAPSRPPPTVPSASRPAGTPWPGSPKPTNAGPPPPHRRSRADASRRPARRMRSLLLGSRRRADKPVTILQVLPRLLPGGVERDAIGIAGAVADAGGTSLVATAGGPLITEVYRVGAKPVFLPLDQAG